MKALYYPNTGYICAYCRDMMMPHASNCSNVITGDPLTIKFYCFNEKCPAFEKVLTVKPIEALEGEWA